MRKKISAVGFVVVMLVALLYSTAFAAVTDVFLDIGELSATSNSISGNNKAQYWLNCKSNSECNVTAAAMYNTGGSWYVAGQTTCSPGNARGGLNAATSTNDNHVWRLRLTPAIIKRGSAAGTITSPPVKS